MYEKEFDLMKTKFTKKGRIDDGTLGSFEVVVLFKGFNLNNIEKLKRSKIKFQGCYFSGTDENDDPLRNFGDILLFKESFKKESQLFTIAPRKEWLDNQEKLLKFDKIFIKRASINDMENNQKLNEVALRTTDLQKMSKELKEKVSLWINFERAGISDECSAEKFIDYARNVGINEIIFTGQMIKYEHIFKYIRNLLIKTGWHFDINKAMNSDKEFCSSTTLKRGKMKAVLKQIVENNEIKNEMWLSSRSHKYIVEL